MTEYNVKLTSYTFEWQYFREYFEEYDATEVEYFEDGSIFYIKSV